MTRTIEPSAAAMAGSAACTFDAEPPSWNVVARSCRHGKVARLAACHQRKLADRAESAFDARGRRIDPPRRSRAGGEPDGGLELRDRNAAGNEGQRRAPRLPEPQRKLRGGRHEIGRERAARLQLRAARA